MTNLNPAMRARFYRQCRAAAHKIITLDAELETICDAGHTPDAAFDRHKTDFESAALTLAALIEPTRNRLEKELVRRRKE